MNKISFLVITIAVLLFACSNEAAQQEEQTPTPNQHLTDSLANILDWPDELRFDYFVGPELTPSPACLAVSAAGEVFVGVDMIGSLGKDPGKGRIVKFIDSDKDGVADEHSIFTEVDNPRGMLPIGDKLYVLYTTFDEESGIASGMDLSVFEDANQDGVADGPAQPLIQNISSPKFLQSRGTDHSTNGIRMGIDGWIYIAVGDFGFHDAIDRDGTKMTMLGGGVVRVRPDGTEMEIYTHGLRNIYDVAIDPFMNIYTRGNTNDGGGWNVRFAHHIQTGEYGYPVLFKHFTDEIIPALIDVGGGSGTGALYMDDSRWPTAYNKVPMMCDWGRNQLFIHRVTTDGSSFKQEEETFIELPQITDADIDATGQLFLSAWDGAGYRGSDSKGYVVRAVPKNWDYEAFPNLAKASIKELGNLLQSESATARLHAQQELLNRPKDKTADLILKIASNASNSKESRVAAIFTYAQIMQENSIDPLIELSKNKELKEWALRALTDRKRWANKVPIEPFTAALNDPSERIQLAAMVGLGRIGNEAVAADLLKTQVPSSAIAPAKDTEGLHATPNAEIIPAHIAVRALVELHAFEDCVKAIGTESSDLALWALRYMHDARAINGLIEAYQTTDQEALKPKILSTLSRLYQKEAPYDGSWWWSTRPDTHGPYYKSITWESSSTIKSFFMNIWSKASPSEKVFFAELNGRHRMGISEFGGEEKKDTEKEKEVNLGRIANKKGQVGKASIEDVMLAMADIKGDVELGERLYTRQACFTCHSIKKGETLKGPYLGQIGSIMNRDQIAESILKPNASISQGFASVLIKAKGDKSYAGFVSQESADKVTLRNIAGHVFEIDASDIIEREELETSMMPLGLTNSLTFEDFAALIDFLAAMK